MVYLQSIYRISKPQACLNKRYYSSPPWIFNIIANFKPEKPGDYIFGPTADAVTRDINLESKTCLLTGGTNGIGLEMTRCLLHRNCNMLVACRNTYTANVVVKNMCENSDRLRFYETNLSSLASVKKCSDKIIKDQRKIDIVILNAGVFGLPWTLTGDGLETTFQVNYLSQFYLLMNIEKLLAPDARVVFISSESHRYVNWTLMDSLLPNEELISLPKHMYTSIRAYNVSKLCSLLAMHYLGYRWLHSGKSVFCAHPGSFVKTGLCTNWWAYEALYTVMKPFSKSISQAASTPIYCATSPDLQGLSGMYFKDCKHCEESDLARDSHLAFKINDLTRNMIFDRVKVTDDVQKEEATKIPEQDANATIEQPLISNC